MDFGGFLGNDSLKNRLTAAERAGKMSHSYLISGPEGSGKRTLARITGVIVNFLISTYFLFQILYFLFTNITFVLRWIGLQGANSLYFSLSSIVCICLT